MSPESSRRMWNNKIQKWMSPHGGQLEEHPSKLRFRSWQISSFVSNYNSRQVILGKSHGNLILNQSNLLGRFYLFIYFFLLDQTKQSFIIYEYMLATLCNNKANEDDFSIYRTYNTSGLEHPIRQFLTYLRVSSSKTRTAVRITEENKILHKFWSILASANLFNFELVCVCVCMCMV